MKNINVLLLDLGDARGELNEPLGIECIATSLKTFNYNTVDIRWLNMECNLNQLEIEKYDVIGISMNIGTLNRFEELLSTINRRNPKINIIAGGTIPTFGYFDLLKKYPNIVCIRGEGEDTFLELTKILSSKGAWKFEDLLLISNLSFIKDNQLVTTDLKPVDLLKLGSVYRDSDIMKFLLESKGIVRLEGSRGCSWNKCSFCCINAKYADSSWNAFKIDKIIEELIQLSSYGFKSPYFTDEDFFGRDYERAIQLAERIKEKKREGKIHNDMNFFISILANDVSTAKGKEAVIALKEAGLREVFMGIESMCKEQMKRYKKRASIDTNQKAIDFIRSIGLQLDTGYILFDPKMNFEELEVNIQYINDISLDKLDARSLKRLRLQPLTKITEELIDVRERNLDLDNLEYKYSFEDVNVQKVYLKYSTWEDVQKSKVWRLQSISRGEIKDEQRMYYKKILGEIREIDFVVLKSIISNIRAEISNHELDNIMTKAIDDKNNVLSSMWTLLS